MGGSVITPEDVLESLMNDGTIDAIRLKIINQLKGNLWDSSVGIVVDYYACCKLSEFIKRLKTKDKKSADIVRRFSVQIKKHITVIDDKEWASK